MSERVTAFFVVDGPDMAAQGLLLASSLRARVTHPLAIVAYLPVPASAPLPDALRVAYETLGVRIEDLPVPPDAWRAPYPHGNKILACLALRDGDTGVFFDTDMLIARDLTLRGLVPAGGIAAVPEGKPTWGKLNDRWARAYAHFGLPLPDRTLRLTRGRRILFHPYYNAGFIAFDDGAVPPVARRWYDTARAVDFDLSVGGKRPWLDQIALPLALARFAIPVNTLGEEYNFSISDRPYKETDAAVIHYHRYAHNHGWPYFARAYARLLDDLGGTLPAEARGILAGLEPARNG